MIGVWRIAAAGMMVSSSLLAFNVDAPTASAVTCPTVLKVVPEVAPACAAVGAATAGPGAPVPSMPGTGTAGLFDGTPAPGKSLYSQYGLAPIHWNTFDEGNFLNPDNIGPDTKATTDDEFGGFFLAAAVDVAAFGNFLDRLVNPPTFLVHMDGLIKSSTAELNQAVWIPFVGLALAIVGAGIIWRAKRRNFGEALERGAWALGVIGLVGVAVALPVQISHAADNAMTGTVNSIYTSFAGPNQAPGSAAANLEYDNILVPMWDIGEFGTMTGQTVKVDGPKIFRANAYSWAETGGNGQKNPTAAVTKAKEATWSAAAANVKATDPGAYQHMTDHDASRTGAGIAALVAVLVTTWFRVIADILVIVALILVALTIMLIPLVGVIAVNQQFSPLLHDIGDSVLSALLSAVMFSAAAALDIRVSGFLLSPASTVSLVFGVLASAAVAWGLWYKMKPYRHLTAMMGSYAATSRRVVRGRKSQRAWLNVAKAVETGAVAVGGAAVGAVAGAAFERHRERDEERAAPQMPLATRPWTREQPPVTVPQRDRLDVEGDEWQPGVLPTVSEPDEAPDDNPLAPTMPSPDEPGELVAVGSAAEPHEEVDVA